MEKTLSTATAPKDTSFQMRMNSEIKAKAEEVFANCGMTMTEAFNLFIQQSIKAKGLPFIPTDDIDRFLETQALLMLIADLDKADLSFTRGEVYDAEEAAGEFGIKL